MDTLADLLNNILTDYFDVDNDTYVYNLTRDKKAFDFGTMTLNDFEEFNSNDINDITQHIIQKLKEYLKNKYNNSYDILKIIKEISDNF